MPLYGKVSDITEAATKKAVERVFIMNDAKSCGYLNILLYGLSFAAV